MRLPSGDGFPQRARQGAVFMPDADHGQRVRWNQAGGRERALAEFQRGRQRYSGAEQFSQPPRPPGKDETPLGGEGFDHRHQWHHPLRGHRQGRQQGVLPRRMVPPIGHQQDYHADPADNDSKHGHDRAQNCQPD